MDLIILDIREPMREFDRRADHTAPAFYFSPVELDKMMRDVWYCIQHPQMASSALVDYGCRLRDQGHPYHPGVFSFGMVLQDHLKHLGFYDPAFPINLYHYIRRHGRRAIIVGRY